MIVRCAGCGHLFRQQLAAQKDCPRCEREPLPPTTAPAVERDPGWRSCTHKGCGVDFRIEKKRGRPPVKCPAHRKGAA